MSAAKKPNEPSRVIAPASGAITTAAAINKIHADYYTPEREWETAIRVLREGQKIAQTKKTKNAGAAKRTHGDKVRELVRAEAAKLSPRVTTRSHAAQVIAPKVRAQLQQATTPGVDRVEKILRELGLFKPAKQ
jgi:hypothetical protein